MAIERHLILLLMLFLSSMSSYSCWQFGRPSSVKTIENGKLSRNLKECRKPSKPPTNIFSVDDYGAKGDGKRDDTQAFLLAWEKACASKGATVVVPKKNYLLKPIKFGGVCEGPIAVQITGTLVAPDDRSIYTDKHWIHFAGVDNLIVEGSGTINGNGKKWWQNSCKVDKSKPCTSAPTAVTFSDCNDLTVRGLHIQDAQQMHITFDGCDSVQVSQLSISAPGDSPNTDGIHITNTTNINVADTTIGTGDDCISIETGSEKVQATGITCGPGHGISIGSLGDNQSIAYVSGVTVKGAKISGTSNGVRIKTYQGGSGSASNIVFEDIDMTNVENPIIIDQYYCDDKPCKKQGSAVQVKNVLYENIRGTSATDIAVTFNCSKASPCQDIQLNGINLLSNGKPAKAECSNVQASDSGMVFPNCAKN